jgi:hypothetical protein
MRHTAIDIAAGPVRRAVVDVRSGIWLMIA